MDRRAVAQVIRVMCLFPMIATILRTGHGARWTRTERIRGY